jgi:hypothetical protein
MKNTLYFLSLITVIIAFQGCSKEGCTDTTANNYDSDAKKDDGSCTYDVDSRKRLTLTRNGNNVTVLGESEVDVTFYADTVYTLSGFVYFKSGSTLTVEAGTIVKGEKNSKGSLIIERGAKIIAEGSVNNPIVFTSDQAPGDRDYGDWGGIIICGKAPINSPGGEAIVEGGTGASFGGTDANDNSGKLKYVRIEFAGVPFQPNIEINGLTLAGVGSSTEVEYIQISFSGDDAYEWFGGTVNAKHLVAFRTWDDDFDTDFGWQGKVQFVVALRDPSIADASGSNGFESDNDPGGGNVTPYTNGVFSNASLFGPLPTPSTNYSPQFESGLHLRRNTRLVTYNTVIAGFPEGVFVKGDFAEANATADELKVKNTIIAGCNQYLKKELLGTLDLDAWFFNPAFGNDSLATNNSLNIADPFNLSSPNFIPNGGSPVLSGASFTYPELQNSFFESVNYRGAFGTNNWTSGWVNWNPQTTVY